MKECLQCLMKIQRIDDDINKEESEQRAWQEELEKETMAMDDVMVALKEHEAQVFELRKEIDRKSLDIKEKDLAVENDRVTLGRITSNREYKAILTQTEKDKADLSVIEDDLLEEMSRVDEVAKKVEEERVLVKEQEEVLRRKESEVKGLADSSNKRISGFEGDKSAVASQVDSELMEIYNKLSNRGDGHVVTSVEGGVCGGCNMTLTSQTVSELMEGEEIIRCMSCGRILYLEDEKD